MQVNLTTHSDLSVRNPATPATPPPSARTGQDEAKFSQTEALDRALQDVPDVRQEEVDRARDLFTSVQYPPVKLIARLSRLLARDWHRLSD
jgi:hypothetical protein